MTGQAVNSFMSEALERGTPEQINLAKCVASAMYAGGSDTVRSSFDSLLAMAGNLSWFVPL